MPNRPKPVINQSALAQDETTHRNGGPETAPSISTAPSAATGMGDAWVIVELAPDAILVIDEHGHILLANRAAETMFGYDRALLVGLGIDALVPEDRRHAHRGHRSAYDASPRTRPMAPDLDLWARRADGSELPVEISLSPVVFGNSPRVVAIVREVTAQRAREQAVREQLVLDDKERIGVDLHHRVIDRLFAAGMGIQSVLGRVDRTVAEHLVGVTEELDAATREIRSIVFHQVPSPVIVAPSGEQG